MTVCGALADYYQGFLGNLESVDCFGYFSGIGVVDSRLDKRTEHYFLLDRLCKHIARQVQVYRTGSSHQGQLDSLLHMVGDIGSIGDLHTVFCVRFNKIDLVQLLESTLAGQTQIAGPTDQNHGPGVSPSIHDPTKSIGMRRPAHAQTYGRHAVKEAAVAGRVGCLLLVPEAVVVNACALNGETQLNHRNAYMREQVPTMPKVCWTPCLASAWAKISYPNIVYTMMQVM